MFAWVGDFSPTKGEVPMTKQSEKHIDRLHGPHPRFDEARELSIASMQSLAENPVKFALQWSEQWAKFARLRFDRDQEFIGSLAECRDWVGAPSHQPRGHP